MKINNSKHQKTNLLKLKLLKSKIYKTFSFSGHYKLEDIESRLRKSLHVIYKFHVCNKKILFVGTPLYQHKQLKLLTKNTRHTLVPESLWINGSITNQSTSLKYTHHNKKVSEILHQLEKKFDLIVILDQSSNLGALEEGYTSRTPVISLNADLNTLKATATYKVPGNFIFTKKKSRNNFVYSILRAVLKKAKKDKTLFQLSQWNKQNRSHKKIHSEDIIQQDYLKLNKASMQTSKNSNKRKYSHKKFQQTKNIQRGPFKKDFKQR